jgi:hypothetical protein
MFKFRSMYTDQMRSDSAGRLVTKGDPRVTRVGRFIRKTSIDELPQFFNVLARRAFAGWAAPACLDAKAADRLYGEVVDGYFARHRVKPGVTGWAQINGWRGETDTDRRSAGERVRPLLHRELVDAVRSQDPVPDADPASQYGKRILTALPATAVFQPQRAALSMLASLLRGLRGVSVGLRDQRTGTL